MASGRHAPFKAHKTGSVKARGTVSEVKIHQDGKTAEVVVRHKAPASKPEGKGKGLNQVMAYDSYPEETRAIMPAKHAKRFSAGQNVAVHIGPADEIGDSEDEGGEATADDERAEVKAPAKRKVGDLIRRAAAKGAAKK